MKKYVFIVLIFVSVHTASNAAQAFYELCSDLVNSSVSNMTVNYSDGTSTTIGIEDFCQDFTKNFCGSNSSDESISSLPNTLALVGIAVAAVPIVQAAFSYGYDFIGKKFFDRKTAREELKDIYRKTEDIYNHTYDVRNKVTTIKASTDKIPIIQESTNLIEALNGTINQIAQSQIDQKN